MHQDLQYQKRFGAPFFGIHRADLQRVLGYALGGLGLHLGHRLVNLVHEGQIIGLEFANGRVAQVDLVVGADGIRSVVRHFVTGGDVEYSGTSAFRGIVPMERLRSLPNPQALQFWMAPNAHLLHYPIGYRAVNFFAGVEGPAIWPPDGLRQNSGGGY